MILYPKLHVLLMGCITEKHRTVYGRVLAFSVKSQAKYNRNDRYRIQGKIESGISFPKNFPLRHASYVT